MPRLVPTCVWKASPELLLTLDARFGEPVDTYVNGSQVWLRDDGPAGEAIEWRLHPVAGFTPPPDVGTYELFGAVALALGTGATVPAEPAALWDGLEAFPAYPDEATEREPAPPAAVATHALGLAPDAVGMADHQAVGDAWERSEGRTSIIAALLAQLAPG
ncbi:MAG: hypothetical protein ACR2KK_14065 [Acidimicrobiales bacterium]